MGIVIRQSIKTSLVVVTGAMLGALVVWLSARYPSIPQYGYIKNTTNYALVMSQILLFGLNSTLAVYIHKYTNDQSKSKLLITLCLLIPAIMIALFSAFYLFFKKWVLHHFQPDDIPFMDRYYLWLPLFITLFLYMTLLEQFLGSQMKVAISAFMREIVLRIANILFLLLFAFKLISFSTLIAGIILSYLLPVVILVFISLRSKLFGLTTNFNAFSKPEYNELIGFTWYHFLYNISIILIGYMDSLSLPFYDHKGLSSVAIYGVAVFLISILQMPLKALITASFTVLAKAFADDDLPKARDLFNRTSINVLIPTVLISLLLVCNLQNAVDTIGKGYTNTKSVFLILLGGALFNIATGMNDQVISIAKYYKFNFYLSTILMLVLFGLIRFLVPRYGIYGAALSTTITYIVFNTIKYIFIKKKLDMQPFSKGTVLTIIAALPALAVGYFFPNLFNPKYPIYVHAFLDASIRSIIITIIYVLMLLWLKPSADLDGYIAAIRKDKRLF